VQASVACLMLELDDWAMGRMGIRFELMVKDIAPGTYPATRFFTVFFTVKTPFFVTLGV